MAEVFNCPNCGLELSAAELRQGDAFQCPRCRKDARMPEIDQSASTEAQLGRKAQLPLRATTLTKRPEAGPDYFKGMRLAPRSSRLGAAVLDMVIRLILPSGVTTIAWMISWSSNSFLPETGGLLAWYTSPAGMVMLLSGLSITAINAYFLTVRGQSLGKMALDITILRADTLENGGFVTNFLIRDVANWAIMIATIFVPFGGFYGLADALFIFGKDRRCIHDYMARTIVVEGGPVELERWRAYLRQQKASV